LPSAKQFIALRSQFKWNNAFGQAVRKHFPGLDAQVACKLAMVGHEIAS
jgi:hypothetical protein